MIISHIFVSFQTPICFCGSELAVLHCVRSFFFQPKATLHLLSLSYKCFSLVIISSCSFQQKLVYQLEAVFAELCGHCYNLQTYLTTPLDDPYLDSLDASDCT